VIQFDASLSGGGVLLYDDLGVVLGARSIDLRCFKFCTESKCQNVAEFIVAVMGIVMALKKWNRNDPVSLGFMGDSLVALTWIESESFKGDFVMNASILFIMLCFHFRVSIHRCKHLPADENYLADYLSREGTVDDLKQFSLETSLLEFPSSQLFLECCNPSMQVLEDDQTFIQFWNRVWKLMESLRN
jgi:hypothetical protein